MSVTMDVFAAPMPIEQDHYRRILKWEQQQTRRLGRYRMQRYYENKRYQYGENEEPDNIQQPLGIKYIPVLHQKMAHYLFGEWKDQIVSWLTVPWDAKDAKDPDYEIAEKVTRAISHLFERADANDVLHRGAIDGSVYGDTVFQVHWNPFNQRVSLLNVLPEYYHAIWHPLLQNQTLEACVAYSLDRTTAQALYQTPGTKGFVPTGAMLNPQQAVVWEYWNPTEYQVAVDNKIVEKGPNYYMTEKNGKIQPGFLPFVHIPNLAVNGEYWGFGDGEPVLRLADEINFRLADIGDIINYHAHPITLLKNFFGNAEQLPVAADAVWNLGRDAEAEYLEWGGPPPEMLAYIEMLLRVMLETSSMTPVAFGAIEQSQASSAALNIQMLPIIEVIRRKRAAWGPALRDLAIKFLTLESIIMEKTKTGSFKERYGFTIADLERFSVQVKWAPILPRDRLAVVNEQVALLSNHARSIIYSLQDLDVENPNVERQKILDDIKAIAEIEAKVNMMIAEQEHKLNKEMVEIEAQANEDAIKLQMQQTKLEMQKSSQDHEQKMAQDPTTDPARHKRHLEKIKTEETEKRKTLQEKGKSAQTVASARVKAARVTIRSGGKNSDKAKGGSNTDGKSE